MPRRRRLEDIAVRRRRPNPTCANPRCGRVIERWQRLCNACWKRLPRGHRSALIEARSSGSVTALSSLAHEAGAWLRDHDPAAEAARRLGEHS
jgi:hypothetical protein